MLTGFKCGHPYTPANIKHRWKKVREGVWKWREECRACYNKRMREAAKRRRTRQVEFKEQLYNQLPPADLPNIESCRPTK